MEGEAKVTVRAPLLLPGQSVVVVGEIDDAAAFDAGEAGASQSNGSRDDGMRILGRQTGVAGDILLEGDAGTVDHGLTHDLPVQIGHEARQTFDDLGYAIPARAVPGVRPCRKA